MDSSSTTTFETLHRQHDALAPVPAVASSSKEPAMHARGREVPTVRAIDALYLSMADCAAGS